jgi:hypothetical protein
MPSGSRIFSAVSTKSLQRKGLTPHLNYRPGPALDYLRTDLIFDLRNLKTACTRRPLTKSFKKLVRARVMPGARCFTLQPGLE